MTLNKLFMTGAAVILASAAIAAGAQAAVTVDIQQVGPNVILTSSGSLNLADLTPNFSSTQPGLIAPTDGFVETGNTGDPVTGYTGFTGPASFGSGSGTYADLGGGTDFAVDGSGLGVPVIFVSPTYTSGDPLSGSLTYRNQTLAGLGLTTGQYVFTSSADTVTVDVTGGAISAAPEPSTWALMLVAVAGAGTALRLSRRRRGVEPTSVLHV